MPLDPETLDKLTVTLSGDVDLYNKVINEIDSHSTTIAEKEQVIQETKEKLVKSEENNHKFLGQISNLLSKVPINNTNTPQSVEQKFEEVKNRTWQK